MMPENLVPCRNLWTPRHTAPQLYDSPLARPTRNWGTGRWGGV